MTCTESFLQFLANPKAVPPQKKVNGQSIGHTWIGIFWHAQFTENLSPFDLACFGDPQKFLVHRVTNFSNLEKLLHNFRFNFSIDFLVALGTCHEYLHLIPY